LTPGGVIAAVRVHGREFCGACVRAWRTWEAQAFEEFSAAGPGAVGQGKKKRTPSERAPDPST